MTAPDTGNGFQPQADYAVQAQQEEIDQQREEISFLKNRLVYLRAVNLQLHAEANAAMSEKDAQIASLEESLRAERKAQVSSPDIFGPGTPDGVPDEEINWGPDIDPSRAPDPEIDNELGDMVTNNERGPEPSCLPPDYDVKNTIKVDKVDVEKIVENARMSDGRPVPEAQEGLPVDKE